MVRDMEQQLDCRLFERTTRAVALTGHGRVLLRWPRACWPNSMRPRITLGQLSAEGPAATGARCHAGVASLGAPQACRVFAGLQPGVQVQVHLTSIARRCMPGVQDRASSMPASACSWIAASGIRRTL